MEKKGEKKGEREEKKRRERRRGEVVFILIATAYDPEGIYIYRRIMKYGA